MEKIPATVAILTRNSQDSLRAAIESVRDFEEIIVCDGASADSTREIAAEFGARILDQDPAFLRDGRIVHYAEIRNQTLAAASHAWFFYLDSDERADATLVEEIRRIASSQKEGAYYVSRFYTLGGVVVEHASTYPNRQIRFFSKTSVKKFIKAIHERIDVRDGVSPQRIAGRILTPQETDVRKIRAKWEGYIALEAERRTPLPVMSYLRIVFDTLKASTLYVLRLVRNQFRRGTKMPLYLEMERHRYSIRMIAALARSIRF